MKLFLFAAALVFSLSAHAGLEGYAGSYKGKFEGTRGTLTITVNGTTLGASFLADSGSSDIYGGACNATIGSMTKLDMDGPEVDYAVFAFNPGSCADIEGRQITVDFNHKHGAVTGADVSVFERTETDWQNQCSSDPNGGMHCWPTPTTMNVFGEGSFKK